MRMLERLDPFRQEEVAAQAPTSAPREWPVPPRWVRKLRVAAHDAVSFRRSRQANHTLDVVPNRNLTEKSSPTVKDLTSNTVMINYSGHFVANDAAELIFAAGRMLLFNCVAPSPRLTDPVDQLDPFSSQPKLAGTLTLHRKLATIDRCLKAARSQRHPGWFRWAAA
jgi:hypothetical protein